MIDDDVRIFPSWNILQMGVNGWHNKRVLDTEQADYKTTKSVQRKWSIKDKFVGNLTALQDINGDQNANGNMYI